MPLRNPIRCRSSLSLHVYVYVRVNRVMAGVPSERASGGGRRAGERATARSPQRGAYVTDAHAGQDGARGTPRYVVGLYM